MVAGVRIIPPVAPSPYHDATAPRTPPPYTSHIPQLPNFQKPESADLVSAHPSIY